MSRSSFPQADLGNCSVDPDRQSRFPQLQLSGIKGYDFKMEAHGLCFLFEAMPRVVWQARSCSVLVLLLASCLLLACFLLASCLLLACFLLASCLLLACIMLTSCLHLASFLPDSCSYQAQPTGTNSPRFPFLALQVVSSRDL